MCASLPVCFCIWFRDISGPGKRNEAACSVILLAKIFFSKAREWPHIWISTVTGLRGGVDISSRTPAHWEASLRQGATGCCVCGIPTSSLLP